eukprot:15999781-Heterocapsa_arctica.AAC.1
MQERVRGALCCSRGAGPSGFFISWLPAAAAREGCGRRGHQMWAMLFLVAATEEGCGRQRRTKMHRN